MAKYQIVTEDWSFGVRLPSNNALNIIFTRKAFYTHNYFVIELAIEKEQKCLLEITSKKFDENIFETYDSLNRAIRKTIEAHKKCSFINRTDRKLLHYFKEVKAQTLVSYKWMRRFNDMKMDCYN
jgi:hypothetical protein